MGKVNVAKSFEDWEFHREAQILSHR